MDPQPIAISVAASAKIIRFLARNPGVEAGEVSERAHRVVAAGI
jgi:hypothetical protein